MFIARFNIVLAVAVASLSGCAFAQQQDSPEPHYKWLECDVDWIFTPYDVGRDFSVKLWFKKAPLSDIQITLTPTGEPTKASKRVRTLITAVTDSSGTAHFSRVPLGKYTMGAEDGLDFPPNELTVHIKGDEKIEVEWPVLPLPVRALRGKLITQAEETAVELPLQPATVELLDLRTSKVLETQSTIGDGSYEFSTIEPGLYAVRVIPPSTDQKYTPPSGDIPVELDPAAKQATIGDRKVVESECYGVQLFERDAKGNF